MVVMEDLEPKILCRVDEVRAVGMFLSTFTSGWSFFGLELRPQLSLLVLSCPFTKVRLEVELFLRFESR